MNPTGGAISRPVINSSVFPLYSLKDVLSTENIRSAWKQVRGNRGAPGIDDLSVDVFPTQVRPKWMEIKRQILAGEYFPQPVKRVEIPKANGGIRWLGIPTVQDRLLQQGVSQVLGWDFSLPPLNISSNSLSFAKGGGAISRGMGAFS